MIFSWNHGLILTKINEITFLNVQMFIFGVAKVLTT